MSVDFVSHRCARIALRTFLPLSAALFMSACAQNGLETASLSLTDPAAPAASQTAQNSLSEARTPDLNVKPETAKAIKEARALRGAGKKAEALSLLEKSPGHEKDLALVGEQGMLALEIGQIAKAEKLLAKAQDPNAPDWRLQSAYGSALSANGKQKEAQTQFAKALSQAPDHPAVLNNMALALALDGQHDEAEKLLRQASAKAKEPQAKQNLALILGLKGKTDEAKSVAEAAFPPEKAKENIAFFERLKNGTQSYSRADASADATPLRSASVRDPGPIMQLGTNP